MTRIARSWGLARLAAQGVVGGLALACGEPEAFVNDIDAPGEENVDGGQSGDETPESESGDWSNLSELSPDVHCVLAGDGPERAALEALASARGIQHRTRFLGHRNDPGTVYAALDLMVISSDREGMSNAMLEAMAAGVPVVSTPVSGAEDALGVRAGGAHGAAVHSALAATPEGAPSASDAPPGILLQGFGEEELTATLRSLLGDPGRLRAMGAAARARARAEFDFEVVLDRWEALLGVPSPAAGGGPGPSA